MEAFFLPNYNHLFGRCGGIPWQIIDWLTETFFRLSVGQTIFLRLLKTIFLIGAFETGAARILKPELIPAGTPRSDATMADGRITADSPSPGSSSKFSGLSSYLRSTSARFAHICSPIADRSAEL
jgi:hypothetical protein